MKFQSTPLIALSALALAAASFAASAHAAAAPGPHHVYTMTSAVDGNALLVFTRGEKGKLALTQTLPTQGKGGVVGSQGAVTLSGDGRYLFAVNVGSGSVSTFKVGNQRVHYVSTVATGGKAVSVTEHDGLVYVLNEGAGSTVAGFRNTAGVLAPLADGVRPLSSADDVGAAEVSFDRTGHLLIVSEKATDLLTSFAVGADGVLGQSRQTPSAGATPFGFIFDAANHLLVTEAVHATVAASTMSSYSLGGDGMTPTVISAAVPTHQTAACWNAATPDGRYAFTANADEPDNGLSSFKIDADGALTLVDSAPALDPHAHLLDMAVSPSGKRLYVLNDGAGSVATAAEISSFVIHADGTLARLASTPVPVKSVGLAVD